MWQKAGVEDATRRIKVPQIAVAARVRVKEGKGDEYLAAFAPLLEQVEQEPGTLLYVLQRSEDDPHVFWTSEIYADEAAFAAHSGSDVHAAATPVFTELIAEADVIKGELVVGKGQTSVRHAQGGLG
jgi:(4S)-4-hydroxy-5-phosphonooxypentane-2,3-dione isomerase